MSEPAPAVRQAPRGRRVTVALAVVIVILAGVFVALRATGSDRPGSDSPEAGFARDMSTHHAQAVEMSFIVRDRTKDAATRLLAYDIINTQRAQIGMMTAWLDDWGLPQADPAGRMRWMSGHAGHSGTAAPAAADGAIMPGMATRTQLAELGRLSGKDAEVLYLRLMIAHHRAGVDMAQAALTLSRRAQVRRLAQTMVDGQKSEIDLMNKMLAERGAAAR